MKISMDNFYIDYNEDLGDGKAFVILTKDRESKNEERYVATCLTLDEGKALHDFLSKHIR